MAERFLVFLPYARRGVAAAVTAPPDDIDGNPLASHPQFDVTLTLQSEAGQVDVSSGQRMLDSGSVTGIDPTVVIRTDPGPGATDFLDVNMASVELRVPDLPWMFTPAAPAGSPPKLRPWLALAVVDLDRDDARWQASERPLPRLEVHVDALPDHRDLWAWAHVQCSLPGDPEAPLDEAALRAAPTLARLVCPRQLAPGRAYLACLVPTFEAGRRAGLGQPIPDDAPTRTSPAWNTGSDATVELPVYYSWQFSTAPEGAAADFEELVSRLRPATPGECARLRPAPVDVTNPLGLVPAPPAPQTLRLTTALRFAGDPDDDRTELADWDPAAQQAFREALHGLLDVPAGKVEPVVAPPIYGGQHVGVERVGPPPWVEQLNLDARYRIAAGLGAQYVQEEQERLMQQAWQQLDAIDAQLQLRRMAELALTVGDRQHGRHVTAFSDEQLARFAAPSAARFPVDLREVAARTLAGAVQETSLPAGAFTAAFAKLTRPQATVARRFAGATGGLTVLANGLRNAVARPAAETAAPTVQFAPAEPPPAQEPPPPDTLTLAVAESDENIQLLQASAPQLPPPPPDVAASPPPPRLRALAERGAAAVPLAGTLRDGTDPATTVLGRFAARSGDAGQPAAPEPAPVLPGPEFPVPMAEVLASSHPDWLLPGLSSVPEDRVLLLETNRPWVEAFLVGLNHELNRELLWREYRGDLRGSAFRAFWPRDDQAPDIQPIASWTDATPLGAHGPDQAGAASQIVLLIRGALLRRFPDLTLYARPAVFVERDGVSFYDEQPGTKMIQHNFALRLGDDTVAFGFPTAEAVALGQDPGGAGVVFVFEQPPHQPWFGLDATPTAVSEADFWDNVAWPHVKAPRRNGAVFADARVDLGHQPVRWGTGADAAGFAYATFQRPVKMVFHAADLILGPRPIEDPHHDTVQRVVDRFAQAFGPHALQRGLKS